MTNIYRAKDLAELSDKITTNSIGLDKTIQNFWESTNVTYPPFNICLLYTSPSPRDRTRSRMPSSA